MCLCLLMMRLLKASASPSVHEMGCQGWVKLVPHFCKK